VETARYDGLLHGVLFQQEDGSFLFSPILGIPLGDYRSIKRIGSPGRADAWLLSRNNATLLIGTFDQAGKEM
jgi:hypothetical protein